MGMAVIRVADVIHAHINIYSYSEHVLSSYEKAWEDIMAQTIPIYPKGSFFSQIIFDGI